MLAQTDQTNPEGGFADLQAMVAQMRGSMYTPGEHVPGVGGEDRPAYARVGRPAACGRPRGVSCTRADNAF